MTDTPPEAVPFATAPDLPGNVAAGELVESAWGNKVANRLFHHTNNRFQQFTFTSGTATTTSVGVGVYTLTNPGVWFVSWAVDFIAGTTGWGYVDTYLGTAANVTLGVPMLAGRTFEQPTGGATERRQLAGMTLLNTDPATGTAFYLRFKTFAGTANFQGGSVYANCLYSY